MVKTSNRECILVTFLVIMRNTPVICTATLRGDSAYNLL